MPEQGYGCMGLSAFYTSAKNTTPEKARTVIQHVLESGITLLNTATFYGELNEVGFGANLRLLRHCLEGVDRSKYQLMVKIGMDTRNVISKKIPKGYIYVLNSTFLYIQMPCGENGNFLGHAWRCCWLEE